jgi:hypothetical protein
MTEIRDAALHFEAVKIALTQSKEGMVLKVAIHPNDVPKDVILDSLGTRYMVAMVKINDAGEPERGQDKTEGDRAVAIAGALCRNERFRGWFFSKGFSVSEEPNAVAEGLRSILGVESRRDLATNEDARRVFMDIRGEFEADFRKGKL